MWAKLTTHENPWVAADNLERLKTGATILVFGLALLVGAAGLVIGFLQA